ncbi:MAG TPA: pectate lyase [Pyrinomonadaceae bacterium]|nr:pectate lyase [Pyrinomonadaceae bacterium]
MKTVGFTILILILISFGQFVYAQKIDAKNELKTVSWREAQRQKSDWYKGDEAVRIADQLLVYQRSNGGWEKNIDMAKPLSNAEKAELISEKSKISETTIDNGSTFSQLQFLAKVINAKGAKNSQNYVEAFYKGFDYLISSQYENGGFPQFFPLKKGYYTHITYNDGAMIGVLELLRSIVEKEAEYNFVDEKRRRQAEKAVAKGIDVILKTQIKVDGIKTVWCAQHDEKTLEPASARNYEIISLSGAESVGIVRFLMGIEKPSPKIKDAVNSAVRWFERSKISGIKLEDKPLEGSPKGFDRFVVEDKNAPPLWARFYEIKTNRPIFTGRDKIIKYSLSEIEIERRTGYGFYTDAPQKLLENDYPKWLAKNK